MWPQVLHPTEPGPVAGDMGELQPAGRVADGVDAPVGGSEPPIDLHAGLRRLDPGGVEMQRFKIGPPPRRDEPRPGTSGRQNKKTKSKGNYQPKGAKSSKDSAPPKDGKGTEIPESMLLAWQTNWFDCSVIELVQNLGFKLNIPEICSQKLAERISKCIESWDLIGPNAWVRGVLAHGYKLHWRTNGEICRLESTYHLAHGYKLHWRDQQRNL